MKGPGLLQPMNPPIADWHGLRVWLVGASSGIGEATASALHAQGATVHVSARNANALDSFVQRHPGAVALPLDVAHVGQVHRAAARILAGGPLDLVLCCAGHYRPVTATAFKLDEMLLHQQVNYVGTLHVLDAVLPALVRQGHGHISLVASVAGYRGLPLSLAYGPTEAALIHLAEALYLDLPASGVGVSVVNPGFVDTPLTAQNRFHMPALTTAGDAARQMLRGWRLGRFEIHFPRRFTWPLKLLAALPFRCYQLIIRKGTQT